MDLVVKDTANFHQTETNPNLLYRYLAATACVGALESRDGHALKLVVVKQTHHLVSLVYNLSAE